jgi:hypothetical protein
MCHSSVVKSQIQGFTSASGGFSSVLFHLTASDTNLAHQTHYYASDHAVVELTSSKSYQQFSETKPQSSDFRSVLVLGPGSQSTERHVLILE